MRTVSRRICGLMALAVLLSGTGAQARVIVVTTTIQAAVDAASPGDIVSVRPGTYRENVLVAKPGITIEGSREAVLDGTGLAGDTGILVGPVPSVTGIEGFAISGLTIQNYRQNGIQLQRVENFSIRGGKYTNNGQYGIYPVLSSQGHVDLNEVSGSNDTGIYIGQSSDVAMTQNIATNNTIGLEVENSSHVQVQGNAATGNSTGILVNVLPGLVVTATTDVLVAGNILNRNNRPNPATDPSDILFYLPNGVGFLSVGGDQVTVANNIALQNNTVGLAVTQLPPSFAGLDPRVDPFPDFIQVRGNVALGNGSNPSPKFPSPVGADLAWDGSGNNDCWSGNIFKTSLPPVLPPCR
jgi:parallel beta-helix repeat protein